MAKKKAKKRVQSKTEKKLRGKLKYQKTKLKKVQKAIYNDSKKYGFDFNTKIGDVKLTKLINDEINNSMKPIANEIRLLNKKLERFNKLDKKKEVVKDTEGLELQTFGSVWERNDFEKELLSGYYQFVDEINVDTDSDLIFDNLFNNYYPLINSTNILRGWFDSHTRNVDLFVDNMTEKELADLKKKRK
jgi:hypothetical protein